MAGELLGRRWKQRVGLARTDDDAGRAQVAGKLHEAREQAKRIVAHLLRRAGDVDVDVRHVQRDQAHVARKLCAQPLELRAREVRPEMAGMQHQLELAETLVGEPRDT